MSTSVIILAAGKGTRMRSSLPKVLQPLAGRPLLGHVIETAKKLNAKNIITIFGHGGNLVQQAAQVQILVPAPLPAIMMARINLKPLLVIQLLSARTVHWLLRSVSAMEQLWVLAQSSHAMSQKIVWPLNAQNKWLKKTINAPKN